MTHAKCKFIFHHIYAVAPTVDSVDSAASDESEPEDNSESDEGTADRFTFDPKCKPFFVQLKNGNILICVRPGTYMTVDEMMQRFKGRSPDTFRMRGKPIGSGYKFYSICDVDTKFVFCVLPYGRCSTKVGVIATVEELIKSLPDRGDYDYVAVMDNYFTYDRTLLTCLDAGVHVVGTARGKPNWPPAALKDQDDMRFNSLHHLTHSSGKFKIYRWMDNGVVYLVSTLHDPKAVVERHRKRPRTTQNNRMNVRNVWGDKHVRNIEIPGCVDTYNQKKVGVDGADQLIASYAPHIRFKRTWMPLMQHALNCMRINSYAVHKDLCGGFFCSGFAP